MAAYTRVSILDMLVGIQITLESSDSLFYPMTNLLTLYGPFTFVWKLKYGSYKFNLKCFKNLIEFFHINLMIQFKEHYSTLISLMEQYLQKEHSYKIPSVLIHGLTELREIYGNEPKCLKRQKWQFW